MSNDPSRQSMPQSPWKKPKITLLNKPKQIKRKPDLFNQNNPTGAADPNSTVSYSNEDIEQRAAKNIRTFSNKFSTQLSNSTNFSFNQTNNDTDLYSFFAGKNNKLDDEKEENDAGKASRVAISAEKLANLGKDLSITNLYLKPSDGVASYAAEKEKPEEKKETFLFEHENLIPIDWTLKTKLRFLSTRPFSCYSGIKSQQESDAILNFSKFNSFYDTLYKSKLNTDDENKDLYKTLFSECINYWTFPYLPWLNLYPRNMTFGNLSSEPLNVNIQTNLSKCWNQSFKSLYNSLKSNCCPYFYVLTQSFIVLFRAQNINGIDDIHAILTPSTKGLRQALQDISFTMPLMSTTTISKSDSSLELSTKESCAEMKDNEEDEDNDDNDDNSDEPDEWLEQIGLNSTVNIKITAQQQNNKNSADPQANMDNRPRSTLLFSQGSDVQALFNFLLNSKVCVANSGPLSGVPPTLLSPLPFVGATLQKLKIEQKVVKSLTSSGRSLTQYAMDFSGPLMPFHIHRLCNLFAETQSGEFEMVANIYDQSAGMNCVKADEHSNSSETSSEDNSKDVSAYLDSSEAKALKNNYGVFGAHQFVRSICFKDDKFCCN